MHTAPPTPKGRKEAEQDTSSFDIVKATQYGAFDRVQDIIEAGFDVNQRDEVNEWQLKQDREIVVKLSKWFCV